MAFCINNHDRDGSNSSALVEKLRYNSNRCEAVVQCSLDWLPDLPEYIYVFTAKVVFNGLLVKF